MKQYIDKIKNNQNLSFDESKVAFEILMEGKANDQEIYDFLTSLSAKGEITGPLSALQTNLSIGVKNPQVSGFRLQEEWRGDLLGNSRGVGLKMSSVGASVPSSFSANFNQNWLLDDLIIQRLGGSVSLERSKDLFSWRAENFRLDRIEVAIPPEKRFKRIFGQLNGSGSFGINPMLLDGQLTVRYPRYMGLRLREAQLKGNFFENKFN